MQELKIIGKIDLSSPTKKNKIICCDDCGLPVDSSFGDPRHKSTITHSNGQIETIMRCDYCDWLNWGQFEPDSIFSGKSEDIR